MLQAVFSDVGTPPKPSKSFPMQWHRAFLGAIIDVQGVCQQGDGDVYIMPRDNSRRPVCLDIDAALDHSHMSRSQAAKTRGRSGWVGTNSFGKLGRLGMATLKQLQYHRRQVLAAPQRRSLLFHRYIITNIPPRTIAAMATLTAPIQ